MTDLAALLEYRDGRLYWKVQARSDIPAGTEAGTVNPRGYRAVFVRGKLYLAHRVVWALHHGEFPLAALDHINGDKLDNRIENLRPCSVAQNQFNRGRTKNNKSGFKGVSRHGKRWVATISANGHFRRLGSFDTREAAHAAYTAAALRLHGEFARVE